MEVKLCTIYGIEGDRQNYVHNIWELVQALEENENGQHPTSDDNQNGNRTHLAEFDTLMGNCQTEENSYEQKGEEIYHTNHIAVSQLWTATTICRAIYGFLRGTHY